MRLKTYAAALACLVAVNGGASAERYALTIGNDSYAALPRLSTSVSDAAAVADALKGLGFKVTTARNLDLEEFVETLADFQAKIAPDDEVVLFYSGHGRGVEKRNYLMPTDMEKPRAGQTVRARRLSIDANDVLSELRARRPKYLFAAFDASRGDPFGWSQSAGLVPMDAVHNVLVLFPLDAQPATARPRRSPFVDALLKHIPKPDLTLKEVAEAIRKETQGRPQAEAGARIARSQDKIEVYYSDRTTGDPKLAMEQMNERGGARAFGLASLPSGSDAADKAYAQAQRDGSSAALLDFAQRFPNDLRVSKLTAPLESRADDSAFKQAWTSPDPKALDAYRDEWPEGRHVAAATAKVLTLDAAASRDARETQNIRTALIVSNSDYQTGGLLPAVQRDAEKVAEALKGAGFQVTWVRDLDRDALLKTLDDFAKQAQNAEAAAIYYSGRAEAIDGVNHVVPAAGAPIPFDQIAKAVEGAKTLRLAALDAAMSKQALAPADPDGRILTFVSSAAERMDLGSPFAAAFAKRVETPGLAIDDLVRLVREDVIAATRPGQEPAVYGAPAPQDFRFK